MNNGQMERFLKGQKIRSRDGAYKGVLTGGSYGCRMEGCIGLRLGARWSDGKITFPCSKGMSYNPKKGWRIE